MGLILAILGTIFLGLIVRVLGIEIGVRHKPLCQWLLKVAAARMPVEERAALESEWLAIIEDLRSPTAQLLHSLSYVLSSFQIRRAIAPEVRLPSYMKAILAAQLFFMGAVTGALAAFVSYDRDRLASFLRDHITISKPAAIALLITSVILAFLTSYANYRALKWYLIRRERRRESAPTK